MNDSPLHNYDENECNDSENAEDKKNDGSMSSIAIIGTIVVVVEAFSLLFWTKSEDFSHPFDYYFRWIGGCGFVFGAAFAIHKIPFIRRSQFRVILVWFSWLIICIVSLFAKSNRMELNKYQLLSPNMASNIVQILKAPSGHVYPAAFLICLANPDDSAVAFSEQLKKIF